MDSFRHALEVILRFVLYLGDLIVAAIIAAELWLRVQLTHLAVPEPIQIVLLVAFAAVLVVTALRLFGGLIRLVVILVLLLIAIHIVMPLIHN